MSDLYTNNGFSRRGVYNPSFLSTVNKKPVYKNHYNNHPVNPVGGYPMHHHHQGPTTLAEGVPCQQPQSQLPHASLESAARNAGDQNTRYELGGQPGLEAPRQAVYDNGAMDQGG